MLNANDQYCCSGLLYLRLISQCILSKIKKCALNASIYNLLHKRLRFYKDPERLFNMNSLKIIFQRRIYVQSEKKSHGLIVPYVQPLREGFELISGCMNANAKGLTHGESRFTRVMSPRYVLGDLWGIVWLQKLKECVMVSYSMWRDGQWWTQQLCQATFPSFKVAWQAAFVNAHRWFKSKQ